MAEPIVSVILSASTPIQPFTAYVVPREWNGALLSQESLLETYNPGVFTFDHHYTGYYFRIFRQKVWQCVWLPLLQNDRLLGHLTLHLRLHDLKRALIHPNPVDEAISQIADRLQKQSWSENEILQWTREIIADLTALWTEIGLEVRVAEYQPQRHRPSPPAPPPAPPPPASPPEREESLRREIESLLALGFPPLTQQTLPDGSTACFLELPTQPGFALWLIVPPDYPRTPAARIDGKDQPDIPALLRSAPRHRHLRTLVISALYTHLATRYKQQREPR